MVLGFGKKHIIYIHTYVPCESIMIIVQGPFVKLDELTQLIVTAKVLENISGKLLPT